MPAVKRGAQTKAPAAKRAKTSTPLEKNFAKVLSALQDTENVVPCREMFVAIADVALKTPKSERHDDQTGVMNMMQEVFMAEKSRWEGRIADAQSVTDAAEKEKTEKVAFKDGEDAKVRAQKEVSKEKRLACEKAKEVLQSCEEELAVATSSQSNVTKKKMAIVLEREEALGVQKSLNLLKEGSCDVPKEVKMHLAAITSLFKAIGVEEALIKAMPGVLTKSPSERAGFDDIALKQIEDSLDEHLTSLAGKIEAAEVDVSDADCAAVAWGAAVELAQEKLQDCEADEKAAQDEQDVLQAALVSARKILKDQVAVHKRTVEALSTEQAGLRKTEQILSSLEFLSEYETPAPVPEETMEEQPVHEAKDMTSEQVPSEIPSPSRNTMVESF